MINRLFRFSIKIVSLALAFFLFSVNGFAQSAHDTTTLMGSLVGDDNIKLPSVYTFQESFTMQFNVIELSTNSEESIKYRLLANPGSPYIGLIPQSINSESPDVQSKMVMNYAENQMISFLATEKSKMAVVQIMPEEDLAEDGKYNLEIEKTDNTKEIAGYTCDEYKLSRPEIEATVWLSPEIDSKFDRVYKAMGVDIGTDPEVAEKLRNGSIMGFSSVNQQEGTRSEMIVTAVNLNDNFIIQTEGYTITQMPTVSEEQKAEN
jgi:hypothetical protein